MKEEMTAYLRSQVEIMMGECDDFVTFAIEAAIYWFANYYHAGQSSELYSILSTSEYHPGPMVNNVECEDELTQELYHLLEEKFSQK